METISDNVRYYYICCQIKSWSLPPSRLLDDAGLVGWDHVLDVDECVRSPPLLQQLQGVLDEVAEVLVEALVVVDAVAAVHCKKVVGIARQCYMLFLFRRFIEL